MKKKIFSLLFLAVVLCYLPQSVSAEEACNHQWEDWQYVEATYGEDGYRYRYCTECWEKEEEITEKATFNYQ